MDFSSFLSMGQNVLELGLINAITVLSLFLSYSMLNVCDLSTDGCFTLGAAVGAVVALSGHPWLSIPAAIASGIISGFVTAFLQTRMGIDSLLSGIIVNTGLYSIYLGIMGSAQLNLNNTDTVFTIVKDLLKGTAFAKLNKLFVALIFAGVIVVFLALFLKTRLGLAIRATGNNPTMVSSSSINPVFTTTIGLCISGGITALSGCLLAQSQKSASADLGSGMVTMALAALLIGNAFFSKRGITLRAVGCVVGAVIFRFVYALALRLDMPAYMLKLVSSLIVIIAISGPYIKSKLPEYKKRIQYRREKKKSEGKV